MKRGGLNRIVGEGVWVGVGQVGSALGALVGMRILTEALDPSVFGSLTLILGIVVFGESLAVNPITQAVLRYYADFSKSENISVLRREATGIIRTTTCSLGALAVVIGIGYSLFSSQWAAAGIACIVAGLFAADSARSLELTLFNAARRQRPMALWTAIDAWARPVGAGLCIIALGASLPSALLGYVTAAFVVWLVFALCAQREGMEKRNELERETIGPIKRDMFRYALPIVPLALVSWTSNWSDRYVLGGLVGFEDVGIYAAAYGIASRPAMMLCGAVETLLRPIYFQAVSSHDQRKERSIFHFLLVLVCVIAGLVALGFVLFSDVIAGVLLAEQYQRAAALMGWIAVGYSLLAVAQVFAVSCYAKFATSSVLAIETVGAFARMAFSYPAILYGGIAGASIGVPVAFGAQLIAAVAFSKKVSAEPAETSESIAPVKSSESAA